MRVPTSHSTIRISPLTHACIDVMSCRSLNRTIVEPPLCSLHTAKPSRPHAQHPQARRSNAGPDKSRALPHPHMRSQSPGNAEHDAKHGERANQQQVVTPGRDRVEVRVRDEARDPNRHKQEDRVYATPADLPQ